MWSYGMPEDMRIFYELEVKVKLTKVEEAPYKCHATYEYEGHIIEADDSCLGGDVCYWYCDTLFKGIRFRTLRGLRKAIQLKVDGKLTRNLLEYCEND